MSHKTFNLNSAKQKAAPCFESEGTAAVKLTQIYWFQRRVVKVLFVTERNMSEAKNQFAKIPHHIITAKISPRAKELWIFLAMESSPEKPGISFSNKAVAERLGCSPSTIARAKKALNDAGLLLATEQKNLCGFQVYQLVWEVNPSPQPSPTRGEGAEEARRQIQVMSQEEKTEWILSALNVMKKDRFTIDRLRTEFAYQVGYAAAP